MENGRVQREVEAGRADEGPAECKSQGDQKVHIGDGEDGEAGPQEAEGGLLKNSQWNTVPGSQVGGVRETLGGGWWPGSVG